ncbi:TIGR01440 family protein [Caldibacillus lycopersici]|uniref:UPF0340 protein OEV98_07035 n=1 Tax=Perspicuibacillus lycopersici TaxID=1325689 RepID=A0AAE3ISC0_9BACI|nr:TIGR01440 family protein [Perspicuibacillus lycopersici]MCU9613307.1 TIGR01440 family protein [Perspicuibacillus lycopersici]
MEKELVQWGNQWKKILAEFEKQIQAKPKQLFVLGCSTSEIAGKRIGTAGTMDIAKLIFDELRNFSNKTSIDLAFQCCEHLNRALVVERSVQERLRLEEVSVVPVQKAGGSMATYAYQNMNEPVVVEFIKADYGIDIGDTFIGMHLNHVAVPLRVSEKNIGHAHVTIAKTRPKLIGGERAVYTATEGNQSCT